MLIIGAGLAGLSCATHLHRHGIPYRILEKSDAVGGRVRTDSVDGFRLDRGFQVLLTAYPEAKALLDYDALDLHSFDAGALVRKGEQFQHVSDPLRHPGRALATLRADIGSWSDKLQILALRRAAKKAFEKGGSHRLSGQSTFEGLQSTYGFSPSMVETFFRPFIGGITLDPSLQTDRAFFEFVMHMFSEGSAALPAGGMQAIPEQLATGLNADWIHLSTPVARILDARTLVTEDGTSMEGEQIVLASDMSTARGLSSDVEERSWNGTTCLYFDVPSSPVDAPLLMLNGEGAGIINNVVVPSIVAPGYAPEGRHLVGVSTFSNPEVDSFDTLIRNELEDWFGKDVASWRHLRTYHIPHSLPSQAAGIRNLAPNGITATDNGLIVCGDHLTTSSINGAMASGRHAAEYVLASHQSS